MTHGGEFWLAYQFASRGNVAPTTQLIELEYQHQKLIDLEDVLDYAANFDVNVPLVDLRTDIQVFRQGFVEPRHRPVTYWARRDGAVVRASDNVDELLKQGVGRSAESALRLIVDDAPTTLWFTYHYVHNPKAKVSTQRVRLNQGIRFEHVAHLTNHVFGQGWLAGHYRPHVHWQTVCGKKIAEDTHVAEVLGNGFGISDENPLKLIIDAPLYLHHHHRHHHGHCEPIHHIPPPCEAPCHSHVPHHNHGSCPASPTHSCSSGISL